MIEIAVLIGEGEERLPPHAIIYGQPRRCLPRILDIRSNIVLAVVQDILKVALLPGCGFAEHEVTHPQTCEHSVEGKRPACIGAGQIIENLAVIGSAISYLVRPVNPTQILAEVEV